jgi:Protein of unknown function (DUF1207)
VAASPGPKVLNELRTGLFPGEELLFKPLIADPRWPHFALAYQSYLNDKSLKDVAAVSFGESLSIYRDQLNHGWWEVGIQVGVFAFFDLDAVSKDLVNADYFVAALGAYRYEHFSALARLFHQSSHLGDEFLLRSRVNRVNLSYEGADLKLSYEFFGDVSFSGCEFVMRPLTREQRPGSPNTSAIEGCALLMFAVEVIAVAAPDRAGRRLDLEEGINRPHGVEDMGIIRGPQTKTHQGHGIGTDDGGRRANVLLGRAVFDGHETLLR